jgi:2-polyprenyl-6-methoxyphenol hydroxylase-like FAD-dependent oxidoreductase
MLQHDIVIIGGGGAGLRAAIEIGEKNPELNIAVVSKVYPDAQPYGCRCRRYKRKRQHGRLLHRYYFRGRLAV